MWLFTVPAVFYYLILFYLQCTSLHFFHSLYSGLIYRLQQKFAPHGVKLSIPRLQGESDVPLPSPEPSEPGLVRLLTLLCGLELNGNLGSEVQQMVEKERACILQDSLLQGLLDTQALRHCLDITMENSMSGKIKVLEVRLIENNRKRLSNPDYPDAEWLNYFSYLQSWPGSLQRRPTLLPRCSSA